MKKTREKGDFIEWLLMLLALSVVIFAVLIPKENRQFFIGIPDVGEGFYAPLEDGSQAGGSGQVANVYSREIRLGLGNASYSNDPMSEYITIDNTSQRNINITGWRLENGKGARTYTLGGQRLQYASDTAIIPQGTKMISPRGPSAMENIILKPGDSAIITSGGPGNISPYTIVSFKENACTGYLKKNYTFPGNLERSCPAPANEVGVSGLDSQCRDYIRGMQYCRTPDFGGRDANQEVCKDCVDGRAGLSSSCISFIKERFNYAGCIANHSSDINFEGRVWHIYLHRPWEMWASSYETIYLYDAQGKLITNYSY